MTFVPSLEQGSAPVNTFIWGSCVSRDTFGVLPEEFTLTRYVARQSLISAGTDATPVRAQLTDPASKFQARMVRGDLAGDLYSVLDQHAAEIDIVLIDLVDERGGVIRFDDAYATKLSEFWGVGGREASRGAAQIAFGTDEHFALWAEGAQRFAGALRAAELLDRALVIHAPWAAQYDTGEPLEIPEWMIPPAVANQQYGRYSDGLRQLGLRVVELPEELARTSKGHQWGPSPFHYQHSAYEFFAEAIGEFAASQPAAPAAIARRDTAPWGDGDFTEVDSVAGIPEDLGTSMYLTIRHNGYPIDLYIDNQGAATTLVSFHAALGGSGLKPPIFTGRAISEGAGMNRIFASDPALLASEELGLAWFLGTNALNLTTVLTDAICLLQARMGGQHLVFFGMSGGGFAALNYAHQFPGSLALPVNPQTRILDYAEVHWDAFARACFGSIDASQSRAILESHQRTDQRTLYGGGFSNSVLYVQNSSDAHIATQMIPWFEAIDWADGAMSLVGDWGDGHRPPPAAVLKKLLSATASANGDWHTLASLSGATRHPTREAIRERTGR